MTGLASMELRARLLRGRVYDRIESTQRGMRMHFTTLGPIATKERNKDLRFSFRTGPTPEEWVGRGKRS